MEAKTLAALIAGAEKWDRNALANVPDDAEIYAGSCKLCEMFANDACLGCPVSEKTGFHGCGNTPWERADDALFDWDHAANGRTSRNARARFRRAAAAEAKFLRSLIPADAP